MINRLLLRHKSLIVAISLTMVAVPSLYLLLLALDLPVPYIQLSDLHKLILISGEVFILLLLYLRHFSEGTRSAKFVYFGRDFLIVNCFFLLPFVIFYTNPYQSAIPFLNYLRPYILLAYYALLFFTIIFILSSLPSIRRLHNWLVAEIDKQRVIDDENSKCREEVFISQYPRISSIPILGWMEKKLWRTGWGTVFIFSLIFIAGLLLRIWNLDVLPPNADETLHLFTATEIVRDFTKINQGIYSRSLLTVTLPVALFFKIFGINLWVARFAVLLVNMLGLLPLYAFVKRINKPVALIAVGLFAFSPWMIATARNVREYAVFPLFFYLTALLVLHLYEALPDRFDLIKDFRILLVWKNLIYSLPLVLIVVYIFAFDPQSTFKIILVMYPILGFLILRKVDFRSPTNRIIILIMLIIGVLLFAWLLFTVGGQYIEVHKKLNTRFIELFYLSPPQQWYYNRPLISILLLIFALIATCLWDKRKFVLPFSVLIYISSLLALSFFRMSSNRPRYATSIQYWHIILMAVGLFCAYTILTRLLKHKRQWLIVIILVLLFWNIPQTIKTATHTLTGIHPITTEYHANMDPSFDYLRMNTEDNDVLVTTGYLNRYYRWSGDLQPETRFIYDYRKPNASQVIYNPVEIYSHGWIALDYPRGYIFSKPLPYNDFEQAGKSVEYIGFIGDVFIYRWGE